MSHVCEWPCPVGHAVQLSCPIVLVGLTAWPLQLMQTNETLWNELISRMINTSNATVVGQKQDLLLLSSKDISGEILGHKVSQFLALSACHINPVASSQCR